jgi:TonB family protein
MTHLFILWLALFAAPAANPAIPPPNEPPTAQSAPTTPTNQVSPTSNTNASPTLKVGDGVTAPKIVYQPEPKFTKIARKQKVSGVATVSIIVDTEGNPRNVHIIRSIADNVDKKHQAAAVSLDQAAIDAVKQYKFTPATLHGKPVPVYLNVEVNFQIN